MDGAQDFALDLKRRCSRFFLEFHDLCLGFSPLGVNSSLLNGVGFPKTLTYNECHYWGLWYANVHTIPRKLSWACLKWRSKVAVSWHILLLLQFRQKEVVKQVLVLAAKNLLNVLSSIYKAGAPLVHRVSIIKHGGLLSPTTCCWDDWKLTSNCLFTFNW